MAKRNQRGYSPNIAPLEARLLLHAGHMQLAGMLDGIARATAELSAQAQNRPPRAPRILEPATENQRVAPGDVHMETAPFSDPDPADTHFASDFEILLARGRQVVWRASNVTGPEKTHIHLGDGTFVGSHAGMKTLRPNTQYILRVRHSDSSGLDASRWSPWSTRSFRTTAATFRAGRQGPISHGWEILQPGFTLDEAAGGFQLPVGIAFVPNPGTDPDQPSYYVAELYGNIKVVSQAGAVSVYAANLLNFNPTGNFPGSGEMGLAGIVVEPNSGDLFATLLYADPSGQQHPKVVRFTSNDGGLTAAEQTTILDISQETQGASHQISSISFGPDGKLYVHMGDGMVPSTARQLSQFRGKILRMNLDGTPATDNPFYDAADGISARDYVFASGLRNPFGGAWRARDRSLYMVENGPSTDRLARVLRGRDYGWNNQNNSMRQFAAYNWNPSVAPVNIAFVQPATQGGSRFPAKWQDTAFVTESGPTYATGPQQRGKRIVAFNFDAQGRRTRGPVPILRYAGSGKATAAALAAGPDGLYFSELYPVSSGGNPTAVGARILRIRYVGPLNANARR